MPGPVVMDSDRMTSKHIRSQVALPNRTQVSGPVRWPARAVMRCPADTLPCCVVCRADFGLYSWPVNWPLPGPKKRLLTWLLGGLFCRRIARL